jgi:hypothetical protein
MSFAAYFLLVSQFKFLLFLFVQGRDPIQFDSISLASKDFSVTLEQEFIHLKDKVDALNHESAAADLQKYVVALTLKCL